MRLQGNVITLDDDNDDRDGGSDDDNDDDDYVNDNTWCHDVRVCVIV